MASDKTTDPDSPQDGTRRSFLKKLGVGTAGAAAGAAACAATDSAPAWGGLTFREAFDDLFRKHYKQMSAQEIEAALQRIEHRAKYKFGVDIHCKNTPPQEGVVFGYAINLGVCRGYRDCVQACIKENNLGRDSQVEYIRVLEMDRGDMNLEHSDQYYNPATVPQEDKYYLPVQCMHCDDPPCVKACPSEATWTEPDGIVVVDYDWCIGCRYCMAACPYAARHFNWTEPQIPSAELNPNTHYLGNRPRPRGVVEKCHFCIHRTREGRQPACMEACPTGARIFGNLLDPDSEIRYVLRTKTVFRLKEELGTEPKFWYYMD